MHDFKFRNSVYDEIVCLTIINECMRFESEFCGLNKKSKNV